MAVYIHTHTHTHTHNYTYTYHTNTHNTHRQLHYPKSLITYSTHFTHFTHALIYIYVCRLYITYTHIPHIHSTYTSINTHTYRYPTLTHTHSHTNIPSTHIHTHTQFIHVNTHTHPLGPPTPVFALHVAYIKISELSNKLHHFINSGLSEACER